MRKLFLDDFRTVTMAQTYTHPRDRHFYNGEWDIVRSYTPEQEEEGALLTVFLDGKLVKEYTLEEIRERIKRNLYE
jgi:nicotinic acid phosphoribosyltransferase